MTTTLQNILQSLTHFWPEIFLAIGFLLTLIAEMFLNRPRSVSIPRSVSSQTFKPSVSSQTPILRFLVIGFVVVSIVLVINQWQDSPQYLFQNMLLLDHAAVYFKILIAVSTLCILAHIHLTDTNLPPEFYSILLAVLLGLFILTMAVNGLSIYLSLEMVSIGGYMMVAFGQDKKASEGGLKYLLFGAISSSIMLYGFSLLYGMGGTFDFLSPLFVQNMQQQSPQIVTVALFLSLAGLLFKLSLAPFQVYAPDVYEAAETPVAAFLSVVPKAAALLVFLRFSFILPSNFQSVTAIVALVSILVGNFSALWQTNFKRLLAYSSIAQAGFILVGIVSNNQFGVQSAIFYISVYSFMNLAAFFLLDILGNGKTQISDFAGMGSAYPFLSVLLVFILISLVGLPPTAGFTAKLLVFSSLWESYQTNPNNLKIWLLIIGLLNAVVALFYYLKIPFQLFLRQNSVNQIVEKQSFVIIFWAIVITIPTILFFLKTDWLFIFIKQF